MNRLLTFQLTGAFAAGYLLTQWMQPVTADAARPVEAPVKPAVAQAVQAAALQPAPPPLPVKPKPLPRIVAVDRRVAKRTDQLRPGVKKRLERAAKALPEGVTLLVASAYRTREEQAALQPTFGVKAAPGTSTHEHGRGIDLNVMVDGERIPPREQHELIGPAMEAAGFRHLGPSDPVHYSIPAWGLSPDAKESVALNVPTLDETFEENLVAAAETVSPEAEALRSE